MSLKRDNGHSFVELLIMLAVLGALVAVVTPTSDVARGQLDAFTARLRSDLHYTQERAMSTGTLHGFRVVSATSYEIFVGVPGTPATDPYKRTPFLITVTDFYSAIRFPNVAGQPTVTYSSNGTPTITGGPNIVVSDGTATKTIVITPGTGVPVIQ